MPFEGEQRHDLDTIPGERGRPAKVGQIYDKLDLICKANSASYEVKGTRILISGAGCD